MRWCLHLNYDLRITNDELCIKKWMLHLKWWFVYQKWWVLHLKQIRYRYAPPGSEIGVILLKCRVFPLKKMNFDCKSMNFDWRMVNSDWRMLVLCIKKGILRWSGTWPRWPGWSTTSGCRQVFNVFASSTIFCRCVVEQMTTFVLQSSFHLNDEFVI